MVRPISPSPKVSSGSAFWWAVLNELAGDWPVYVITLAYAAGATALAVRLGTPQKLVFLDYLGIWLRAVVTIGLVFLAVTEIPASIRANPKHPLDAFIDKVGTMITPRLVAGSVLMFGASG